jgi:hypothetical protein
MMSDECGDGAAGGEGSAASKELSGGGVVACTDGVAAAIMGG